MSRYLLVLALSVLLFASAVFATPEQDAGNAVEDNKDGPVDGYNKHTVEMTHGDNATPFWDAINGFKTPQFHTRVHRLRNTLHITWVGYVARLRCSEIKTFLKNAYSYAAMEGTQIVQDFHDIRRMAPSTVKQCFKSFVKSVEGSSNVQGVFIVDKSNQKTSAATAQLEKLVAGKIRVRVISDEA